jgi:glycerol-3-phosphate O-acyltransferase
MGPLLRMIGVFFVRRSFQGAVFYTKVFSAYVSKLIEEGYHLNVFIEGTRSRSGKLLQPQLGMLTILMDVFQKHPEKDLIFVPVYIGYDQVPEEKEYLNEIQGGKKKPENARQLVKFGKLFKKRFGKIYVKFTEPLSLKDFLGQLEISSEKLTSKEKNTVSKRLGECIMAHIDQATVVTPQALVAGALLNGDRPLRTFENLWKQIDAYMAYLNYKKADLSESLIIDPKNAVEHILNQFVGAKIIDTVQTKPNQWSAADTLKLNKNKRAAADYYKNNCIIHFVPAAFTAIAILVRDAFQFQTMDVVPIHEILTDLFRLEFTHDPDKNPDHYVRKSIKAFIDDAILIPHPTLPDTYAITSPGFRKLKDFAAFVIPFVEAYWIVLKWLSQEPKKNVDAKARLRKILNFGEHLLKKRSIRRSEALSNLNIENAISYFNRSGLRGMEDKSLINYYHDQMAPIMDRIEI